MKYKQINNSSISEEELGKDPTMRKIGISDFATKPTNFNNLDHSRLGSMFVKSSRRSSLLRDRDSGLVEVIYDVKHKCRGAGCTRDYLAFENYIIHGI